MSLVFLKYLVIFIMTLFVCGFSFLVWFLIKNDLNVFKEFFKPKPIKVVFETTYKKLKIKRLIRFFIKKNNNLDVLELLNKVKSQKNNNGIN